VTTTLGLGQLTELKESIKTADFCLNLPEPGIILPETKTEAVAVFLQEFLQKEVKERNGELFLNGNEIKEFLTKIIPERFNTDFAVKEGQNIRKLKKDVLDKARKLFPNQLFLNINKNEDMRPEYCSDCHRP
jgi:hypothetical protein